jgi:putative ABC transport system ATP-binding protein
MNPGSQTTDGNEGGDTPIVSLEDVRFGWQVGDPDVIRVDRFQVQRGERLFVEGPSGSGKSTLLSLLGGVVRPQAGRVTILGSDIGGMRSGHRDRFRADHLGFVFQLFNLVPYLSLLDNVTLPCGFSRKRKQRADERDGSVASAAMRLLAHLELDSPRLLTRRVTDLSIGQQQRGAVARALIGSP